MSLLIEITKFVKYLITYSIIYGIFYFSMYYFNTNSEILKNVSYIHPTIAAIFSVITTMFISKYIEIITLKKYHIKEMSKVLDVEFTKEFTTNIHHELSTPVLVLENCFYNIADCKASKKEVKETKEVFDGSFEQVITILNKSSSIKECKLTSSTNLYDVMKTAFDNLSFAYTFKFFIDEDLKKLTLKKHENFSSADFINSIFALAKNSLEAGADRFDVYLTRSLSNFMILFIDNGVGIKDNMNNPLIKKDYEKIFDMHYSTKEKNGTNKSLSRYTSIIDFFTEEKSSRGVGLWLNRTLLKYGKIDLTLQSTNRKGTTFKLILKKGSFNEI